MGSRLGNFPRRVDAEQQTNGTGNGEGDDDPHERECGVEKGYGEVKDQREQASGDNAEQSADHAQRNGLDGELQKDVAPGGADGFADAYFTRAFGDADKHDVHDADPADHEAYRRDGNHEEK